MGPPAASGKKTFDGLVTSMCRPATSTVSTSGLTREE